MQKDFDKWKENKKKVNDAILNRDLFFHEREIRASQGLTLV
ncbi:MAG: hypothetical protein WCO12_01990 [bacterium]